MDQIKLNGLLWDAENLEIDGKTYFTFDEAQEAAISVGKRLPTGQEYRQLKKTMDKMGRREDGNALP